VYVSIEEKKMIPSAVPLDKYLLLWAFLEGSEIHTHEVNLVSKLTDNWIKCGGRAAYSVVI
jgi:hypothetical protein